MAPLILGVNRTQDASLCLMRGSQLAWAMQKEPGSGQDGRVDTITRNVLKRLPNGASP